MEYEVSFSFQQQPTASFYHKPDASSRSLPVIFLIGSIWILYHLDLGLPSVLRSGSTTKTLQAVLFFHSCPQVPPWFVNNTLLTLGQWDNRKACVSGRYENVREVCSPLSLPFLLTWLFGIILSWSLLFNVDSQTHNIKQSLTKPMLYLSSF
jgi:hypothetical protein